MQVDTLGIDFVPATVPVCLSHVIFKSSILRMHGTSGTQSANMLTAHLRPLQAGTEALATTGRRLCQLAIMQGAVLTQTC